MEPQSQVLLLSHKKTSKHGLYALNLNPDYFMQKISGLMVRVGSSFCLSQLLAQVSYLNSKTCHHICIHVIFGSNFYVLISWDCMDWHCVCHPFHQMQLQTCQHLYNYHLGFGKNIRSRVLFESNICILLSTISKTWHHRVYYYNANASKYSRHSYIWGWHIHTWHNNITVEELMLNPTHNTLVSKHYLISNAKLQEMKENGFDRPYPRMLTWSDDRELSISFTMAPIFCLLGWLR